MTDKKIYSIDIELPDGTSVTSGASDSDVKSYYNADIELPEGYVINDEGKTEHKSQDIIAGRGSRSTGEIQKRTHGHEGKNTSCEHDYLHCACYYDGCVASPVCMHTS